MLCLQEDIFSLVQIDIHMHLKAIKLSEKQDNHRSLEHSLFPSIIELLSGGMRPAEPILCGCISSSVTR